MYARSVICKMPIYAGVAPSTGDELRNSICNLARSRCFESQCVRGEGGGGCTRVPKLGCMYVRYEYVKRLDGILVATGTAAFSLYSPMEEDQVTSTLIPGSLSQKNACTVLKLQHLPSVFPVRLTTTLLL